jgi:hypothetical protein
MNSSGTDSGPGKCVAVQYILGITPRNGAKVYPEEKNIKEISRGLEHPGGNFEDFGCSSRDSEDWSSSEGGTW